jgi:hypothetical protein
MQEPEAIREILASRLRYDRERSNAEWSVWEHKTLNIHRGVLVWHPLHQVARYSEVTTAVRKKVAETFKRSWWRGFAFGVFAELPLLPEDVADCQTDIDVRENENGTWQWSFLACPTLKVSIGIHTWTAGYLSPVYQSLADHHKSEGYNVGNFKKEKDQLMAFLTAASGKKFKEYQPT